MRKKYKTKSLGYSIIELLVVIIIISIIVLIAVSGSLGLIRKTRICYTLEERENLISHLEANNFQRADGFNYKWLMRAISIMRNNGEEATYRNVTEDDIKLIPCCVLQETNHYWETMSGGKFSYVGQNMIWKQEAERDFEEFQEFLGWSIDGAYVDYPEKFIFDPQNSFRGHLPAFNLRITWKSFNSFEPFSQKLDQCSLG